MFPIHFHFPLPKLHPVSQGHFLHGPRTQSLPPSPSPTPTSFAFLNSCSSFTPQPKPAVLPLTTATPSSLPDCPYSIWSSAKLSAQPLVQLNAQQGFNYPPQQTTPATVLHQSFQPPFLFCYIIITLTTSNSA